MLMHNMLMFKMLSFRLYLIINKKDIQVVHELLDSPSYMGLSIYYFLISQNIFADLKGRKKK